MIVRITPIKYPRTNTLDFFISHSFLVEKTTVYSQGIVFARCLFYSMLRPSCAKRCTLSQQADACHTFAGCSVVDPSVFSSLRSHKISPSVISQYSLFNSRVHLRVNRILSPGFPLTQAVPERIIVPHSGAIVITVCFMTVDL